MARQKGADIKNEIETIKILQDVLGWDALPEVLDFDEKKEQFVVTLAKQGERLSMIVGDNADNASMDYMYEYGQTLAKLHQSEGRFHEVKDRIFFHIPEVSYFEAYGLEFVYEYLTSHQPTEISKCFCHGDFHYANLLWEHKHISAILDFELSGIGNKEFDIAWALVRRPRQKFLNTKEELMLFMEGYSSVGNCNWERVRYYMVLGYSYFYKIGRDMPEYQSYIRGVLEEYCA